jgi:pyruvate,water dikinase
MDQGKDDQATPPAWLFGLLLRVVPFMRRMMRTAAEMWASDLSTQVADEWDNGGRVAMRTRTRELRDVDRAALDDPGLIAHLTDVLEHLQAASDVHARLWGLGTAMPSGHLGVICERLLGWGPTQTLRLLQGFTDVADAADDLDALADVLAGDPQALRLLRDDPAAIVDDPGPAGDALRAHLERHGHQMVGMDLGHPTWAEDPRPLLAMVTARLNRRDVIREDARDAAREAEHRARHELADRPDDLATFEDALARARRGIGYGDDTEVDVLEAFALVRYAVMEAGRALTARGALARPDDVLFLDEKELFAALRGGPVTAHIDRRRGEYQWAKGHQGPKRYGPEPPAFPSMRWAPKGARPFLEAMMWVMDRMTPTPVTEPAPNGMLTGTPASPGRATGTVRVIRDPSEFPRIQPDDVLVCPCTVAAWSVVFPLVSALVTEVGGPLSHPGILAREFGIPAVLGVNDATTRLQDGQQVTVDGTTGRVELVVGSHES